jgi:hypothetical protein
MVPLPPINQLISRCKALAALDLILSPDWQGRHYSFNSNWSENEEMASMRNGCGDEWWIVFHRDGWAALKGLGHESLAWSRHGETLSSALQLSFPSSLREFSTEPAFLWDQTSFAYYRTPGDANWIRANDLAGYSPEDSGDTQLLAHVVGSSADYATFATDYYESDVAEQIVAGVFALQPITTAIVSTLNPSTSLENIAEELYGEIRYPRASEAR